MDSMFTAGEVADALGVSVRRVHRAARAGAVASATDARGRRRFDARAVDELRRRWGAVPRVSGLSWLSRETVMVLAALSRRPLGLSSARAAARAAGVSQTTAARALRELAAKGYVEQRVEQVVEGRVRDVTVWAVRWGSPEWLAVASDIGRCVLPVPRRSARSARVPRRLGHLFWNVDLAELDVDRDGRFIADRILRHDDPQALAWMAVTLRPGDIEAATHGRGLSRRRAAFGRVLAMAGHDAA